MRSSDVEGWPGNCRKKGPDYVSFQLEGGWKAKSETASFAGGTFDIKLATVKLNQRTGNGQTEAAAANFASQGMVYSEEFFKEVPLILYAKTNPGIGDTDRNLPILTENALNLNCSPPGGIFAGIR